MTGMLTQATGAKTGPGSRRVSWLRAGIATGISALAGVLTALAMPRGPPPGHQWGL